MAKKHPGALKVAPNVPRISEKTKGSEFQDRVIQKLHSMNPRFGYVKNLNLSGQIYSDLLCYSIKKGDPKGATSGELYAVDFIAGDDGKRFVAWQVHPPEELVAGKRNYTCAYPRPGAPDYSSGSSTSQKPAETEAPTSTIVGACGTYRGRADASCSAGKFHPHPPDTEKEYLWTCRNIPHNGKTRCRQSKRDTASTSSGDTVSPVGCRTLNTQIYVLRKQLDEYKKAYRGKRVKKWFGLKRDSCNNVKMKDREKFERCQGLANSIHNTQRDISASTTEYNKRCRP